MTWESGAHGSTFGGNPVCCAAALATLDVVEQSAASRRCRWASGCLRESGSCRRSTPVIGDVRGRGLMVGVEFVKDRATREPYPELIDRITERAFRKGLLLLGCGKSTFRLAPPLVLDEYDVDTGLAFWKSACGKRTKPT